MEFDAEPRNPADYDTNIETLATNACSFRSITIDRNAKEMSEKALPMRIVVADDHALVRGGIGILIKMLIPNAQLIECNNFEKTLTVLDNPEPVDLLLLDLLMPGMDPVKSIQQICSTWPDLPVVVVSVREDIQTIRQALRAGAAGYIPKTSSPDVTMNAIRLVLSGGIYVPPNALQLGGRGDDAAASLRDGLEQENGPSPRKAAGLTSRQVEILDLIAEGKSNKAIAADLELAPGTIKMHLSRIYKVLNVKSRTEAMAKFAKLKEISK